MNGWLAKTRVRHIRTGATGTVVGMRYWYADVVWDHGAQMAVRDFELERSPDDWLSRAVKGTS